MLSFIYILFPTLSIAIQSYFVKFGEVKTLFEAKDALDAQLIQIDDEHKIIANAQYCYLSNRTLYTEGQTFALSTVEQGSEVVSEDSDLLIDMVILGENDIYGLTINNRLFHVSLNSKTTKTYALNFTNYSDSLPQLIGYSNNLIFAYSNYAFYLNFDNLKQQTGIQNWQSRQTRYYSEIIDCYLFSAIGLDGLEIYLLNQEYQSYNLNNQSIGLLAVDFRDFSIFKIKDSNYILYILCKINGVIVIDLTISNEEISSKLLLKNVGPKNDGIALTINSGGSVFVAYKTKNQYYVIQFTVEINSRKWGSVNRFNISNKILDIDVNEEFILVQGFHTHFLIYYMDKQNAIPFQLTSVKQFVLADSNIYGTTSKYLFQFQPKIQPFQIKCFIDKILADSKQFERKYKLLYRTNQGWKQREFKVRFNQSSQFISIQLLFFILLVVVILILLCVAYNQCQNQRQKLKESQQLEQKIKSLPQNRASKLLMPHTFRATNTNAETRINTNNYQDENTMLERDMKIS
ncbi:unnamed protein product (macronuclear) [Paramecium tetraurelia]|uniref:Transmembrane protein n=1 Tax=Paramecium tetraurelia TaxID=5888 RepID=A0BF78_PARTE|nr:uncharacterized protein GSPATT00028230001 [Paramecium tetraurelia]CAK57195.1 unnamed protein product [Paramecium tetraurelia]|eukprot:XP_001424593.1 hypothetical protein (macronuclear) [Paramecium tetraurelia strain d4-2]